MSEKHLPLPRIAPIPRERNEWVLLEDYHFAMPWGYGDGNLWLPAGLRTDLASVPRFLWSMIAPFELSGLAPLLHDALYRSRGNLPDDFFDGPHEILPRNRVDKLFLHIMKLEGVNRVKRGLAYQGVRSFGGKAWGHSKIVVDLPLAEYLTADGEEGDIGWGDVIPFDN